MSALIWLAIVGVWGFVLIPMWLRHHDGALEQRSADRFSAAMRVLSRRGTRAQAARAAAAARADLEARADVEARAEAEADGLGDVDHLDRQQADDAADVEHLDAAAASAPAEYREAAGPPHGIESRTATAAREVRVPTGTRSSGLAGGAPVSGPYLDADPRGRGRSTGQAAGGSAAAWQSARIARPGGQGRATAPDGFGHDGPDETAHTVAVGPTRPVPPARTADTRRQALQRLRRQRLGVLVAAMPITIGLAVGLAGMWIVVQLLVDAGLVAYVTHLRRSTQTERRLAASRAARDRRIEAERAARRASRSSTAPAGRAAAASGAATAGRVDPPVAPAYAPVRLSDPAGPPLTAEELATAQAQTVDLAGYAPAAQAPSGPTAGPLAAGPTAGPPAAGPDDEYVNNVRVTGTRPVSRPNARPTTSRPGRVQVNPPGTHGGLTAPPAATAGSAAPHAVGQGGVASPPAGQPAAGHDDEAVRVLRPAVGS